jgi:hypothetical protein
MRAGSWDSTGKGANRRWRISAAGVRSDNRSLRLLAPIGAPQIMRVCGTRVRSPTVHRPRTRGGDSQTLDSQTLRAAARSAISSGGGG